VESSPDNLSLVDAVRKAHDGDTSAFDTIYRRHQQHVYAICLRMVRDPVEAEDLTQETFVLLLRKIHTFRGEAAFSSWLYRLATNVVLMSFRQKRPASVPIDETTIEPSTEGPGEFGRTDYRRQGFLDRITLHAAVDSLPDGYRTAFILHDMEGYRHTEVARILGCSIGNSKSQSHRARKRLRELLCGVPTTFVARGES
jgi:RNA polymerase sigma-70 factor (ECF subfamily)